MHGESDRPLCFRVTAEAPMTNHFCSDFTTMEKKHTQDTRSEKCNSKTTGTRSYPSRVRQGKSSASRTNVYPTPIS